MVYQIPSDEKILGAVQKVFKKYHTVSSQHQLKKLVEKELQGKSHQFHVSGPRLRKVILASGLIQVEIHTREGDPDKILYKCPVCGNPLQRVKNQTIYGGEVTLEFRCEHCGYWTGKKKKIPTLYIFHLK
jgi:DNA-directed RNA polymerase subunit RPC12/RpoP